MKNMIDLSEIINGNPNLKFNNENLSSEEIEKLKMALTQIFWEKQKNIKK